MARTRPFVSVPIGGELGISVELNRLQDVIDYEEGIIRLTHGYPRFVPHRAVTLQEEKACHVFETGHAVAFASRRQADYILDDFRSRTGAGVHSDQCRIEQLGELAFICLDSSKICESLRLLRRTWGTGFDVHQLCRRPPTPPTGFSQDTLVAQLRNLEGKSALAPSLFQSGMAAISAIAMAARKLERRLILIGPAYVDTKTIAVSWPEQLKDLRGCWLNDFTAMDDLEQALQQGPALILFESPTNPLLTLPDIPAILALSRKYNAITATDATIATAYNWRPLDHGIDIVMHSSSKFLGGHYNHLGGVVATASTELKAKIDETRRAADLGMCQNQQMVLFQNLAGFGQRMARINDNAQAIVNRLQASRKVDLVNYPGLTSRRQAELKKQFLQPGASGLLSFTLADGSQKALAAFYDRVCRPIKKGPGLGGETTLMCPYVMLAHYNEPKEKLRQQGLDFHLIRLSVGTEPVDDIWSALNLD